MSGKKFKRKVGNELIYLSQAIKYGTENPINYTKQDWFNNNEI